MQFHDILASIIHDMKNSLGMVLNTLEEIGLQSDSNSEQNQKVHLIQQEAKRLNNNLIELLTLYKIENERISANIDEIYMPDFLMDMVADNQATAAASGIELSWHCEEGLSGFFDEGLIRGVVNSVVGNGLRYSRSKLVINAAMEDGYLVISVEDDGAGYPEKMLAAQESIDDHEQLLDGRTQLGLFFASLVVKMHRNKDKEGYIRLQNENRLSGGCFSLFLP